MKIQQNCKFFDFNHPTPVWWQFSKKKLWMSINNLHCQKLKSLGSKTHCTVMPYHSRPPLRTFTLEVCCELCHEETRVMGLSSSEDNMIITRDILTQYQHETDGWMDGFTTASTVVSALHSKLCWRAVINQFTASSRSPLHHNIYCS